MVEYQNEIIINLLCFENDDGIRGILELREMTEKIGGEGFIKKKKEHHFQRLDTSCKTFEFDCSNTSLTYPFDMIFLIEHGLKLQMMVVPFLDQI